jgi:hypothetical protein
MKTNRSPNLTAAATANVSRHSGKKPGQTSHKRKSTAETSFVPETRPTLKEVLAETPSNNSLFLYSTKPCSDDGMRIKLSRMSREKPQKPVVKPTENTPIELIKIIGNIRVCAGCKGNLKDGPATHQYSALDLLRSSQRRRLLLPFTKKPVDTKARKQTLPCF